MLWSFQSPSVGPFSASKNVAPVGVLGFLATWSRFALMICFSSFFDLYNFVKPFGFLMLLDTFFNNKLRMLRKCAHRHGRKHIFESRFLPTSCARRNFYAQNGFKTSTLGGAFPSCAVQKRIVFADWVENGPPGKPSLTSLAFSHAFYIKFS